MTTSSNAGGASSASRERAANLYREKKYHDAIKEYGLLIDAADMSDSNLHVYYSNRSACHMQVNAANLALEDAEMCKSIRPTWPKSYTRMAAAQMSLRKYRDAVHSLEKALDLEPQNAEVRSLLSSARSSAGVNDGYDGYAGGGGGGGMDFQSILSTIVTYIRNLYFQVVAKFVVASPQQRMMAGAALIAVMYWLYRKLFARPSYDDMYYDADYGEYSGGGGQSRYGLSWTTWLTIMGAAWRIPPMFPNIFGDYAKPFFGLNFTTFMYLLNMLTAGQRFGGGGLGGMFGGRGRGRRF
jgi:tetratricopeptide (TPR) repeat protein